MTDSRAASSTERGVTLSCQGCGWTITLLLTSEGKVNIEPVDGWEIAADERRVLCERCATGWRPQDDVPYVRDALVVARDFIKHHPAVQGDWPMVCEVIDSALAHLKAANRG